MNKTKKVIDLGNIILSNKVIVSDPCYDRGTWCMATDLAVKPGKYKTWIVKSNEGNWGNRVAFLFLVHEKFSMEKLSNWEPVSDKIGVDSGQCGVFDDSVYPLKEDSDEAFYDECCSLTLGELSAGTLSNNRGVVTSSGYGDGCYELFAATADGERVALKVDFHLTEMQEVMEKISR